MEEYRLIGERLEKELLDVGKEKHYRDLIELIDRIADYITTVLYTYCIGRQENLSQKEKLLGDCQYEHEKTF